MELWRLTFRNGFAPQLSDKKLNILLKALQEDDQRLLQGCTTSPPPNECVRDFPVEAACLIGFANWQCDDLETVGEVEESFAKMCFQADQILGEPAACRHILNWFDESPREEVRRELIGEINHILAQRQLDSCTKL